MFNETVSCKTEKESRFVCNLCRVAPNQEQMLKSWMRESCLPLFRTVNESQTRWPTESHEPKYKMKIDRDTHTHTQEVKRPQL